MTPEEEEEFKNDAFLSGKVAMSVFESAIEKIPKVSFALSFLDVLANYKEEHPTLCEALEDEILDRIRETFSEHEEAQGVLIKREVNNFSHEDSSPSATAIIDKTVSLYRESISRIETEKIWSIFLTHMLEYLSKAVHSKKAKKHLVSLLQSLFREAFQKKKLSCDLFIEWLFLEKALVEGSKSQNEARKELLGVIIDGCERWSNKPSIWTACLSVLTQLTPSKEMDSEIEMTYKRGVAKMAVIVRKVPCLSEEKGTSSQEKLTQEIQQFVSMFIKWGIGRGLDAKKLLCNLESASNGNTFSLTTLTGRRLNSIFKSLLLETAMELSGWKCTFSYYNKYRDHHPVTQDFYETVLSLGKRDASVSSANLDSIFEDYIREFGSKDHSIWLEYTRHLQETDRIELLPSIYTRAVKSLDPSEAKLFMETYSK